MEIKGFNSSVYNNKDFQTVKNLFEENDKLSSKNITKTTAPACWEGKPYEVHIQTDDGTPVTFLFDIPNKPNESGTPETAWYVPDEQLEDMLNTNLSDLIKDDKFIKAYIDKDNDGNPELSFGSFDYRFDHDVNGLGYYTGRKLEIDENSNGISEYSADFKFYEPVDENGAYGMMASYEEFDDNEDGAVDLYSANYENGEVKLQKRYNEEGKIVSSKELNENGTLIYLAEDEDNDGVIDNWSEWDNDGNLTYNKKYESDGNGGWIEKETGKEEYYTYYHNKEDNNWSVKSENGTERVIAKRNNCDINENITKTLTDADMDGEYEYSTEYSWKQSGNKTIRNAYFDSDGDGRAEYYEKTVIKTSGKNAGTKSTFGPNIKESIREFFEGLFK